MVSKHESFQLWESSIFGVLLQKNNYFVTFSKIGISVAGLGSADKKIITDNKMSDRMLHPLESVDFLKVDPENFVLFECAEEE
mgnify:CR=1 FL=1